MFLLSSNLNREKTRVVAIPVFTWKNLKRTSAELERPMSDLLADAWKKWSERSEKEMVLVK